MGHIEAAGKQLKWHFAIVRISISFQQLGNQHAQFRQQSLSRICFCNQSWNIIAGSNPYLSFVIPFSANK